MVNLILNYYDFGCATNSIFFKICTCLEVSNCSLNTRSEVETIAAAMVLHLCESRCKREVDAQSMVLEFNIGGVLILADKKYLTRRI